MPVRFAAIVLTAATLLAPAAHAQTMPTPTLSMDEARDIAIEQGVRVIDSMQFNAFNGRWEIEGRDETGRELELDVDASTGVILELDRE